MGDDRKKSAGQLIKNLQTLIRTGRKKSKYHWKKKNLWLTPEKKTQKVSKINHQTCKPLEKLVEKN